MGFSTSRGMLVFAGEEGLVVCSINFGVETERGAVPDESCATKR